MTGNVTALAGGEQPAQFLEGNIGENLGDLKYDDDFLDKTPKAWSMKQRIDMQEPMQGVACRKENL